MDDETYERELAVRRAMFGRELTDAVDEFNEPPQDLGEVTRHAALPCGAPVAFNGFRGASEVFAGLAACGGAPS